MEGEGCVLVEEAGEGAQEGESPSSSLSSGGLACLGSRDVQEAGDGAEFEPLCRACGTRDRGQSVITWIH